MISIEMNTIYTLLALSVVTGVVSSIINFFIHHSPLGRKPALSQIKPLKIFITNIYQFNKTFLGLVNLALSLCSSIILTNILFIFLYCGSLTLEFSDTIVLFGSVIAIRAIYSIFIYRYFFDEKLLD